MLGYCQLLDRQRGGNKVTGGERLTSSSTFIKMCFYQDEYQFIRGDQAWDEHKLVWSKNSKCPQCKCKCKCKCKRCAAVTQHKHSGKDTPSKPLRAYTLQYCIHTQKYRMANKITTTFTESHTVMLSTRKLNGKLNKKLQSALQPHYKGEMLHNDKVKIFHGFPLFCLSWETLVKQNESIF